jgi:hypothetical protein
MIYRGYMIRLLFHPLPLSRQQVVSFSQSSCVLPVKHTFGSGEEGMGEEPNHSNARKPGLLYKSFSNPYEYYIKQYFTAVISVKRT